VLHRKQKGPLGWPDGVPLDLNTTNLLQIREGGGRASGFHLVEEDSLTLPEMVEDGGYEEVLAGLKAQLLNVVRQSIEIGFIKREEL